MATRIGVGESTRFLAKHKGTFARLAAPGGFTGERFLGKCAPALGGPGRAGRGPARLHLQPDRRDRGLARRPAARGCASETPAQPTRTARARSRPLSPVSTTVSGSPMLAAARLRGQAAQLVVRLLGQPHHPGVVAEVGVAQLRPPVEAELLHDGAGEGPHQEVREHVGAGLLVEEALQARRRRRTRRSSAARAAAAGRARGRPRRGRRRSRSRRTRPRAGRTTAERPASARTSPAISCGWLCSSGGSGCTSHRPAAAGRRSPPPAGRARRRRAGRPRPLAAQKASCSTKVSLKSGRSESST